MVGGSLLPPTKAWQSAGKDMQHPSHPPTTEPKHGHFDISLGVAPQAIMPSWYRDHCTYIYTPICTCHMHTCHMHMYMYMHIHMYMHACTCHVHTHMPHAHAHVHAHTHVHARMHMPHAHVHAHATCTCTCTCTYTCTCTHAMHIQLGCHDSCACVTFL